MNPYILLVICIILAIVCAVLIIRIAIMKNQLRSMREELPLTRDMSYNRQLTVQLVDEDVTSLAKEINHNLDYQKQLKLKSEKNERSIKQSVSDIAHDLRTPLTVIKGNLQMLESTEQLSPKGSEYLHICMERADTMKQMAEDFFELSVLESDSEAANTQRTDLTAALVEFILGSEAVIRCNGIQPEIALPEKSLFVMAEPAMLQRMLNNLLSNILKHGGSSFSLSLAEQESCCVVSFSNQLMTDSRPDPEKLFDRTYRADKARHGSGAGLGLYIVKLLAEKQGADVSAKIYSNRLSIEITFNKV